ncbi:helix-turn-helix domain-containing protein [Paraburkholderia caballeronis]|uniref:MarR family transcriptional regulator n=1 Tax=Paraburkholderia caballeronis TaxID=416943 RepID=A0A1H7L022_9BURK|nr:hypothetical protein [Paraburkholderia caballeronis]PXW28239.1 hypothetical protein C7403_102131 [Paraburkholderia caballeronis]PXX03605.1 hypothetical protein C7407_102131 [Paraburkholderia caballeronis]RAK04349.1 hypothetical protein C7409_102131 [Paraburkholderia caballeronis]SED83813.1 hypothetical protein SAMN05445871_4048 [Paraburkholderia caballeronis]SEK92413.1 hypothetical protein SAMN05192542_104131 [Paraburkholderia caballeronis]
MHPTKVKVFDLVAARGAMTAVQIADHVGVSSKQARSVALGLVDDGYFRCETSARGGPGKPGHYVFTRTALELPRSARAVPAKVDFGHPDDCPWWPAADLAVEAAMRGMVWIGRAA